MSKKRNRLPYIEADVPMPPVEQPNHTDDEPFDGERFFSSDIPSLGSKLSDDSEHQLTEENLIKAIKVMRKQVALLSDSCALNSEVFLPPELYDLLCTKLGREVKLEDLVGDVDDKVIEAFREFMGKQDKEETLNED